MKLSPSTARKLLELDAVAQEFRRAHAELIAARCPKIPVAAAEPNTRTGMAEARDLCDLFYAAGPTERRLILVNLNYAPIMPSQPSAFIRKADSWRLDTAVLRHNGEAVVRELERALGISRAQARRIVSDASGEPIVVAARALDLPPDVLQRMLLFLNPRIGQSVGRVYELADLFREISVAAARRMAAIWREADEEQSSTGHYGRVECRTGADHARRAFSAIAQRPPHSQELRQPLLYSRA
jgi:hypothetical protein